MYISEAESEKGQRLKRKEKHSEDKDRGRFITVSSVIIFTVLFAVHLWLFIQMDDQFPGDDNHGYRSMMFYNNVFMNGPYAWDYSPYPPLYYYLTGIFYNIFGMSMPIARSMEIIFAVIFILSMFGIGYETGGKWAGLSVMALSASSPLVLILSREYFLEFPQTATTAMAFYCILRSGYFRDRKYSVLAGVAMAISFLIKWSAIYFLIFPIIWYLIPIIHRVRKKIRVVLPVVWLPLVSMALTFIYLWKMKENSPINRWFLLYLILVLIPCVWEYFIIRKNEERIAHLPQQEREHITHLSNYVFFLMAFALIASPWCFDAAYLIQTKIITESAVPRSLTANINALKNVYRMLFIHSPILLSIGTLFILFIRKNRFLNMALPLNTLFITLLLLKAGFPVERYWLSLVIFASTVGGFWLAYTRWGKYILSPVLILFSIISFIAWTPLVADSPPLTAEFFANRLKYELLIQKPVTMKWDSHSFIRYVSEDKGKPWINTMVYRTRSVAFDLDFLYMDAFNNGIRFFMRHNCNEIQMPDSYFEWEDVKYIFMFHKSHEHVQRHIRHINNLLPMADYEYRKFNLSDEYRLTVVKRKIDP